MAILGNAFLPLNLCDIVCLPEQKLIEIVFLAGDCGGVPNVDNAMPDVRSATSAAGTIATYTCNGGYIKLDGGATITCQNDDTWTQHTLRCGRM